MMYEGSIRDVGKLLSLLSSLLNLKVIGLRYVNKSLSYGELNSIDEAPLNVEDVQAPSSYKLVEEGASGRFRHSFPSLKYFLYPPVQDVLYIGRDFSSREAKVDLGDVALFGIKPCDLHSMKVFDGILMNRDPYYTSARSSIKIVVVEECVKPSKVCFCGSLGTGPWASDGFDVAFARLSNSVVFKPGSSIGSDLLKRLNVKRASDETMYEYREAMDNALKSTKALPELTALNNALEKSMGSGELWTKVSRKCVGCSNCNMVCPTCFCTEFFDEVELDESAVRLRKWHGCLSYSYGLVAGGHFRPKLYMRYRHFILHKFLFYPNQVGLIGCVGCGRCITWCPLGVDIRETLWEVFKSVS
ncbi:MAG: 4Fe-4S dicluster domain-containing protein [Desulfurococcaceae archaeon]|nr:4Fe-4S dicluster domain-containing protein [Sulfolobales archaeon]MDW8170220.1 4Fe-4S dicluster domain-containing protein [Desulfurococcaceae archaeon]